jgi:hypothetical protein
MPIVITGVMACVYTLAKLLGADTLVTIEAYRPVYTLARFLETSGAYPPMLFFLKEPFTPAEVAVFWAVLFGLGALLRRRPMLFGAAFAWLAFLPINFITVREGFVLYIPLIGFGIWVADLLLVIFDWLWRRTPWRLEYRPQALALVFVAVLVPLAEIHSTHTQELFGGMLHAQELTWKVIQEFERAHPRMQRGAKVLLRDSPIEADWDIYFIAKLYFNDPSLQAAWVRTGKAPITGDVHENFDHELRFEDTTLVQTR